MPGMSEKEKEKAKFLLVFELAKKFVNKLDTILDLEEVDWNFLTKKWKLTDKALDLKFQLKETKIDEIIEKLDKAQKKIEDYTNAEDLEEIPS
jgi:hypothetical protein